MRVTIQGDFHFIDLCFCCFIYREWDWLYLLIYCDRCRAYVAVHIVGAAIAPHSFLTRFYVLWFRLLFFSFVERKSNRRGIKSVYVVLFQLLFQKWNTITISRQCQLEFWRENLVPAPSNCRALIHIFFISTVGRGKTGTDGGIREWSVSKSLFKKELCMNI